MELALAAVVIVIGSYVQSSIGFGLAIISAPLLFIIDPLYVPGPVTVCALTLSLANTYHHRKAVSLKGLQYAIIGRIPGTIAGGFLLLWEMRCPLTRRLYSVDLLRDFLANLFGAKITVK